MIKVFQPLSFWMQLASFFFTLSGIHGDLLVIRFFLFCAYAMLFINAVLGSPLWPGPGSFGDISVDSLVWAIIGLYVHGSSLLALVLDERKVGLTDDEAALWRMFYRTGGLSQRIFKVLIAPSLNVVEFQPGDEIPTEEFFYIVYQGQVRLSVYDGDQDLKRSRRIFSGGMFDLSYLGMFRDESIFSVNRIRCWSIDKTRLFQISRVDLERIAHERFAKGVFQSLLIYNLSFVIEGYMLADERGPKWRRAPEGVDRIFSPLQEWEKPEPTIAGSGSALHKPILHLIRASKKSFAPPWPFAGHPNGIRQTLMPPPLQGGTISSDEPSVESQPRFQELYSNLMTSKYGAFTERLWSTSGSHMDSRSASTEDENQFPDEECAISNH